jgi:hypothetical protein
MDRIAAILCLQWRAYWRRFQRPGNLTTNNAGVWILFAGIAVFKFIQQLPGTGAQLARGETTRYQMLLVGVFLVWMLPVMGESWRSISSRGLLHMPLTSKELFCIRAGSVFVSPASWIIAACSLAFVYPLAKAAHPMTGAMALVVFMLLSVATSLTIAHVLRSAHMRKLLLAVVMVLSVIASIAWLAKGKGITDSFEWPTYLAARTAVAPNALGPLATLAVMMAAAFGLSLWTFTRSLQFVGNHRSQRFTLPGRLEFPGRFGGLLKKDLRYFTRLLDLYFALPVVILFVNYLVWTSDPSPAIFRVVLILLFLTSISMAGNVFGLDTPLGLDRYNLFPLSGRDILFSKNLAFVVIFGILAAAIFPFALWRFGVRVTALGLVELVLLMLAYTSWGNWMSVRDPHKMQFYRFSAGGSPADGVTGMLFGSLPGVIMIYLLNQDSSQALWLIIPMTALSLVLYYLSVTRSGRRFEERQEHIRNSL